MKFCPMCGTKLPEGAMACPNCGFLTNSRQNPNAGPQMNQNFGQQMNQDFGQQMNQDFGQQMNPNFGQQMNQNFGQQMNPNFGQQMSPNMGPQMGPNMNQMPPYMNGQMNGPMYGGMPGLQLKTDRSLLKYILLSMITCGIYGIVVMSSVSTDINTIASKYDGKSTMHYCLIYFLFSWLTCGIVPIVWYHRISNRIGDELNRRGIDYTISAKTFWGWGVLGSLILVGPFIYQHRLLTGMNLLSEDYNNRG